MNSFSTLNQEFNLIEHDLLQLTKDSYRAQEEVFIESLLPKAEITPVMLESVQAYATKLVVNLRKQRLSQGGMDAFLLQYDLSTEEGIALMCLAEALLRIPDNKTIDALIKDKIIQGNWGAHFGESNSKFVNAATAGLMLASAVLWTRDQDHYLTSGLKRLLSLGGEPLVRQAVYQSIRILSHQFVMGRNINEALKRAVKQEAKGYRYSYDMLGEAAYTKADAEKYFQAYLKAIEQISMASQGRGPIQGPGISIKLSALHPRFAMLKRTRILNELVPVVKKLVAEAQRHNIGLTIDAEEADTLFILLEVVEAILIDPAFMGWDGFGLAVQAYQKRAADVISWLANLARKNNKKIMLRLVKGAYWDTEIKQSQVKGLSEYPVFTRKITTDVNYIHCVKCVLAQTDVVYPQFATHNAFSVAVVKALAEEAQCHAYEFQCLHGMGDPLYSQLVTPEQPCRIYAPVGSHEDLLAYLVRRLLENGANTSFVNRIADANLPIREMVQNPVEQLANIVDRTHPAIVLPRALYGAKRLNSLGLDLNNPNEFVVLLQKLVEFENSGKKYAAAPTIMDWKTSKSSLESYIQKSPIDSQEIGSVYVANEAIIKNTLKKADKAYGILPEATKRAELLLDFANKLEDAHAELIYLLMMEGGKTVDDAVAEMREAVDFCRYYGHECLEKFVHPVILKGVTGEYNQLSLHGRGVVVCISPWNFPLAIFIGQVVAAFAAGNSVIAKPASQTSLIAAFALELLYQVGVPKEAVQLLPASGALIGQYLLTDPLIAGVVFTGSTQTAYTINQILAQGRIVPFIAETGGQNTMIVDSSALAEQVVKDVIQSSFKSAGQRCSALRVLYLQSEIADKVIEMLKGAMAELSVGDPRGFSTDIGPVIDEAAKHTLEQHKKWLDNFALSGATQITSVPVPIDDQGYYFTPCAYEIQNISQLTKEVFGPILHVIRYDHHELDRIIDDITATGFGLTLGIHSRIAQRIAYIHSRVRVGNVYVNRDMVGAVVGVQPFGGEGLSGTGPKAGGPHYLTRLAVERTLTVNTTAAGGNATLMSL